MRSLTQKIVRMQLFSDVQVILFMRIYARPAKAHIQRTFRGQALWFLLMPW